MSIQRSLCKYLASRLDSGLAGGCEHGLRCCNRLLVAFLKIDSKSKNKNKSKFECRSLRIIISKWQ